MIRLSTSVCINAPAPEVWERLKALEAIPLWSAPVKRAWCSGAIARGAGAERTCELSGGVLIKEHWTEWNEGSAFRYEAEGIPMVKRAANRWSVRAHGADQALLTSEAEIELKGGVFSRLLEPAMEAQMRTMGARSLAAFKYLVERGVPYLGRHSDLPAPPTTC